MNLIKVLEEIKTQIWRAGEEKKKKIQEITEQYDAKIADLKNAYKVNYELNTVCIECEGKGKVRYYDGSYEDRGNLEICPKCGGDGIKK